MSSISSATCAFVAGAIGAAASAIVAPVPSGATSMGRIITKFVTGSMRNAWLSHAFMRSPERMR